MAMGNPALQFDQMIKELVSSGKLVQLSPHAQQAFVKAAQQGGVPQDPSFQSAVQEASAAGLMPHMTAKDWAMFAAIPLAAVGGAALMGGIGGAGAAGGASVGIGESGAVTGITPAVAGGIGEGAVAGGGLGGGVLGALGKFGGMASDIGSVASGAAGGMAAGRRADADANMRATSLNNQAQLGAAQFNRDQPSVRTNQVARGDVMHTMQDAPLTGDARIDKFSGGGLRPSAFGADSRAAGAEMSRQAMGKLMNPTADEFHPTMTNPTDASLGEDILGGVGLGSSIFGLLSKYGRMA